MRPRHAPDRVALDAGERHDPLGSSCSPLGWITTRRFAGVSAREPATILTPASRRASAAALATGGPNTSSGASSAL